MKGSEESQEELPWQWWENRSPQESICYGEGLQEAEGSQGHSNSSTTWEETEGGKRDGEQLSQLCEPEQT